MQTGEALKWFFQNLWVEILFGVVLIPLTGWVFMWLYHRFYKAHMITRVLRVHNNPTRTWRKGVYAADRFMDIFEAGRPVRSEAILMYGGGDGGGAWHNSYLDKGILEKYGLVETFEEGGQRMVKATQTSLTKAVYKILFSQDEREKLKTNSFSRGDGRRNLTP
ncbi:MAG: hypothetical protein G01um10148_484 [Parcubacteria group bacterium Gr01-1014_8]|nr:MAG: hypothetical protein G01um10148_484 [Parcubacteria group bacterium Gr01-1014_8]